MVTAMFPEEISLRWEGVPFEHLEAAHDYATLEARRTGRRRRVVCRKVSGGYPWRRWVVLPT